MATTTTTTNKPLNPRAQDLSPKGYNRASLYSGKALDFDGVNDLVEVTEAASLDFATNFTHVAYVNLAASQSSRIFYSNYAGGEGAATGISDSTNNQVKFYTKGAGAANTLLSSTLLNVGQWYQVITTYDGATKKMYINGRLDASVAYTDSVTYTSATNRVGALSGVSGQFFSGLIAGVRVFNTALTSAQVSDLYLNPEKIVPDGVANSALKLWLPMMEGAGTTAYDGSGNGNHGTINGATWTSGIGAPVAQTALVGWNKGTNLYAQSENVATTWTSQAVTFDTTNNVAPNGTETADKIIPSTSNTFHWIAQPVSVVSGAVYRVSLYAKAGGYNYILPNTSTGSTQGNAGPLVNLNDGTIVTNYTYDYGAEIESVGNGWYKISYNFTTSGISAQIDINQFPSTSIAAYAGNGTDGIYVWGLQLRPVTAGNVYIPTIATAQTSPVLLPQGLTANKDITGVNAVSRNAYALNLDGASWAEVHDNASLDITGHITLEAWVYWDDSISHGILSKWNYGASKASYLILKISATKFRFYVSSTGSNASLIENSTTITSGWNHIVGVYDGTNINCYLNGSADGSTAYSAGLFPNDLNLEIGKYGSAYYPNNIALPRIYNRALTATEVARNYNADKSKFGL